MKGLDLFRERFADYEDQYLLIGGTAASITMEQVGLEFRATKDLDIVLHVELLSVDFFKTFWAFIEDGGYDIRQASESGKPIFYRFQKPVNPSYPAMIELFSKAPQGLVFAQEKKFTPIPVDEALSSLSAILLDDDYYEFMVEGVRKAGGPPFIGEDRLIPLKAIAWLDLTERKAQGTYIDAKDVRKHLNDVLRLSQLLAPATRISLNQKISNDMTRFLAAVAMDSSIDPKKLMLGNITVAELVQRIARAYQI